MNKELNDDGTPNPNYNPDLNEDGSPKTKGQTAEELAEESLELVKEQGFCEFFSPITGQRGKRLGKECPEKQSWSTIVLDMLASYTAQ